MFPSYLLPPNLNSKKQSKPNQYIQKNQLPQLSKYIETELMKRTVQKEQERRKSLQQQSNYIEDDMKNTLLLEQRVRKKEIDLFTGQKNSLFLDVQERKSQNKEQNHYPFNQCLTIEDKVNYIGDKNQSSNKQRSTSVNCRYLQHSPPSYLMEQQIPIDAQKNMIQCNQILDFKIFVNAQNYNYNIEKKQSKQIPNYINFFQYRFEQPYKYRKKEIQKKSQNILKLWGFIFVFIFRLIKQLRQKKIKTIQYLKELRIRLESSNNLQQIADIKLKWYEKLMEQVILTIKQNKFSSNFKENQNPNDKKFIQNRKQWMINLTLMFFQNLENMTSVINMNPEILEYAQYHILQINKKSNLYVAKRIKSKLNSKEQLLIICDYIYFSFIIDDIIKNSNQLKCINEHHLAESKFQLVSICSLIQILFMNYFKEMQQFQPKVQKIIQQRLNINKTKTQDLNIIEDENIEQNEIILFGLNTFEFYENLIKENKKWYEDIQIFFRNSVHNLESQNNI